MKRATSVDAYIKSAPKESQAKLVQLRKIIKTVTPKVEEKISYGMPYFHYKGRLAYMAFAKHHIGLYVMPPVLQNHKADTKDYHTSKAAIQLPYDQKLPVMLIKKLLKAGIKQNEAKKK